MDDEPLALWEEALIEQEAQELRLAHSVQDELDRLWDVHKDDLPWADSVSKAYIKYTRWGWSMYADEAMSPDELIASADSLDSLADYAHSLEIDELVVEIP